MFDSVDAETGPAFDTGHDRLHGPERRPLLLYLDAGAGVLKIYKLMADVVGPRRVASSSNARVVALQHRGA